MTEVEFLRDEVRQMRRGLDRIYRAVFNREPPDHYDPEVIVRGLRELMYSGDGSTPDPDEIQLGLDEQAIRGGGA